MPLIKLGFGDIALNQPIQFSIYREDGYLLLHKGHVITSEDLLARAYRMGYRDGHAPARHPAAEHAANTSVEQLPLLFGVARITEVNAQAESVIPARPALPDLRQKVEAFHLLESGKRDMISLDLVGVIQGEALIVRGIGDSCAPALSTAVTYEARLFTGSRLFRFLTQLLPDSAGPLGCVFLEYPATVAQGVVRRYPRVATAFRAKLRSGEYERPPVEVVVNNMSLSGAGVSATEDFLVVGQSAQLVMNLVTDGCNRPVTVNVQVRNRAKKGDQVTYGLEFVRMGDEVRRDIKDFLLALSQ